MDPGYWAYDESVSDYYWVDGKWVMAPEEASCGHRVTGAGETADIVLTKVTGVMRSASTAESTTGTDTTEMVMKAVAGTMDTSSITDQANNVDLSRNHNIYDTHFSSQQRKPSQL